MVASLIWGTAERHLTSCEDSQRSAWESLRDRAEASLPAVLPEEDDMPELSGSITSQKHVPISVVFECLPSTPIRSGSIQQWAVGITTAPRRVPTLSQSLQSLIAAGWSEPTLFADGEVDIPREFSQIPKQVRTPNRGARAHYYLTLCDLLQNHPQADAILMAQDDALWPAHVPVREYLEAALWPDSESSLVSAWCCTDDTADLAGWHRISRPWKFGAVAFIYPRHLAQRFVDDETVRLACIGDPQGPRSGLSQLIGEWAWKNQIPIDFPTPSLVQHIGDVSAIFEFSRAVGVRHASRYIGDEISPECSSTRSSPIDPSFPLS